MTSTPPGKRARSFSSAPGRSAVELVPWHQLLDAVLLLLLLEPIGVGVVRDPLLLIVVERARRILLKDLVPDRVRPIAVLDRPESDIQREDRGLEVDPRQHAVRVPAELAALVLRRAVLRELLRDGREVRSRIERLLDVRDLLQLIGVRLEVATGARIGRRDLDPRHAHLLRGRLRVLFLRALGVLLTEQLVASARSYLVDRDLVRHRALDEVVLLGSARLEYLEDVIPELALHRIGYLAHRKRLRGVFELLDELPLAHPAEIAPRLRVAGVVRVGGRELVPQGLVVRVLLQLVGDRARLRERDLIREILVVALGRDEDVPRVVLAEVLVVLRVDRRLVVADAIRAGSLVEDGLLDERVERDPFVLGLPREHLRVVLVAGRNAEVNVKANVLVGELTLIFA